jgi:hypothetical protein
MIEEPKNLWEKKLNKLFEKKSETELEKFLNIVSIIIYSNENCKDVSNLFSVIPINDFVKVINVFDGRTVRFPTKEELKEAIELALLFYYKNIKGVTSYKDIKSLNIIDSKDFSSISIGKKLNKLDKKLSEKILNLFLEMEKTDD